MKSTLVKTTLIFIFSFIGLTAVFAQGGPTPPPPCPTSVPLDCGAIFMLIAGTAYGVKRLIKKKK